MPITYRQHQDTRDGTIYNCVLMPDGKWWSVDDYRWDGSEWISPPNNYYWDATLAAARLYLRSALTLPPGTHLPSANEWMAMVTAAGAMSNSRALRSALGWAPTCAGDDIYGFGIIGANGRPPGVGWGSTGYVGALLSANGVAQTSGVNGGFTITNNLEPVDYYASVRFIVDVFNEPHYVKLFGVNFDGFERGMTVTHSRPIEVVDSLGGSVQLIPHGPAILDEWQVQAELWLKGEWAAQLEAVVPAYGVPADRSMLLPPRNGGASFPGLLPALAGASADRYDNAQVTRFESQGRKGPAIDLHGYFLDFTLRTWADGATTNPSTTPTVTPSDWLVEKFAARQLQDWSTETATVTANGFQASYLRSSHGRRRDVNFNLDHLTTEQANELVAFYRGVRHNATVFTFDNGPQGFQSVSVYLVGLQLHRTGLHWDGTLETVLA